MLCVSAHRAFLKTGFVPVDTLRQEEDITNPVFRETGHSGKHFSRISFLDYWQNDNKIVYRIYRTPPVALYILIFMITKR